MDPVESFEKRIMSIDDEALAAIDAKLEARETTRTSDARRWNGLMMPIRSAWIGLG